MRSEIKAGTIVRHFKNNLYTVLNTEVYMHDTKERYVLYCRDGKYYIRPWDMFMSEVDYVKYPQVTQKYRFEAIE